MSLLLAQGFERNTILFCRNKFGIPIDLGTNLSTVSCDTPHCNCNDIMVHYCIVFLIVLNLKNHVVPIQSTVLAFV